MFDSVFENESPKANTEAPKNISCLALLRYFKVSPVLLRKFDQNVLGCCCCARAIFIIMGSIQTKNSLVKSTTVNGVYRRNKELLQLVVRKCCLLNYLSN